MSPPKRIALIPGDGIGPEVLDAAVPAIASAAERSGASLTFESLPYSADHYLSTGNTFPDEAFRHLRDEADAILLGALGERRLTGRRAHSGYWGHVDHTGGWAVDRRARAQGMRQPLLALPPQFRDNEGAMMAGVRR